MKIVTSILLALMAAKAGAESALSAEEFDAYTRGKTLTYSESGQVFGIEEYFDNRRVMWSFNDGQCQEGRWFENGPLICFVYDDIGVPQCWSFQMGAGGLIAQFRNEPDRQPVYETAELDEPLLCLGPQIGV